MSAELDKSRAPGIKRGKWIWMAVLLCIAGAAVVYFHLPARAQSLLQAALERIGGLGHWAPALFVLLYIAACVALLPASILTVGGGALFGLVKGSVYVSIAATLGATAAFLVGRYLARDWVRRKIGDRPAFAAIDNAVAEEGWRIVLLTRLCPIFPFFLMNYGYGLTRVPLGQYVLATWVGIIPGSTLLVYLGSLADREAQPTSAAGWGLKIFILVTALAATLQIARIARRALSKKLESPDVTNPLRERNERDARNRPG